MTDTPPIAQPLEPASDDERYQPVGAFIPGVVSSGYHIDLRGKPGGYGSPEQAHAWLDLLEARRERVMPVTVLQLGIGAWQRGIDRREPDADAWRAVAQRVAEWAALDLDGHGRFVHHQPMPHTYHIDAGWSSAMAQALGVSLFVRHDMAEHADRAVRSLIDADSELVSRTADGPVLEEYPSDPRPHVLNGWMWALMGLYDYAHASIDVDADARADAAAAFEQGMEALIARLPRYETGRGWSMYDLYPHPVANVASPFYHRLHVDMIDALARISPHFVLTEISARWRSALDRRATRAVAVARKVGFRMIIPRRKAA